MKSINCLYNACFLYFYKFGTNRERWSKLLENELFGLFFALPYFISCFFGFVSLLPVNVVFLYLGGVAYLTFLIFLFIHNLIENAMQENNQRGLLLKVLLPSEEYGIWLSQSGVLCRRRTAAAGGVGPPGDA